MQIYQLCFLFLLFSLIEDKMPYSDLPADHKKATDSERKAYVSVEVKNNAKDSISLTLFPGYDIGYRNKKHVWLNEEPGNILLADIAKISLHIPRLAPEYANNIKQQFLLEPGDSIYITIDTENKSGDVYRFSGNAANKFYCLREIYLKGREFESAIAKANQATLINGKLYNNAAERLKLSDSISLERINILDKYKIYLSRRIYQIIKMDIIGTDRSALEQIMLSERYWERSDADSFKLKKIYDVFFKKEAIDTTVVEEFLHFSNNYIQYLITRSVMECIYDKMNNQNVRAYSGHSIFLKGVGDLYHKVRVNYRGAVRERLLLELLTTIRFQGSPAEMDYFIKDINQLIKTEQYKSIAKGLLKRVSNSPVSNFNFIDTNGRKVTLEDLKGKVVLLDIWFTGCGGCRAQARVLESFVYPYFRNNPDIVFVSLSADQSNTKWLNSVRAETYGLKEYLNIYTNGQGFDHPFMKQYNIIGGPTLMVLDRRGSIYSSSPPKFDNHEALVALLRTAISETPSSQ